MAGACVLAGYLRGMSGEKAHLFLCLVAPVNDRELIPGNFLIVCLIPLDAAMLSYGCQLLFQWSGTAGAH